MEDFSKSFLSGVNAGITAERERIVMLLQNLSHEDEYEPISKFMSDLIALIKG
jgi:hypothetical protein